MTARRSVLVTAAGVLTLAALRPAAQQQPVFTAKSTGVAVNVFVRNGGVPVPALTSADFVLTDSGIPQPVDAESIESLPFDLTIDLDTSGSAWAISDELKADIRNIAKLLRPIDRVRLITFGTMGQSDNEVREILPFQPATAKLPLDGIKSGLFRPLPEYDAPTRPGVTQHTVFFTNDRTPLLDGLLFALPRASNPDRQHLIIVFTDGGENSSLVDGKTVIDAAARSGSLLEIALATYEGRDHVGEALVHNAPQIASVWLPTLRSAAEVTGGEVHNADKSSSLKKTFEELFADIRRSYILRFVPAGVPAAGWHDIVVTLPGHPAYHVQARKGYDGG